MKPNILLFFTDQQRFDTIRALGNPIIRTPNMDRLCAMGTAFTSAYTPSPVCVSARASMFTGQYPMHTSMYSNDHGEAPRSSETFVEALTRAGYRTHGIGKMHFKPEGNALHGYESRDISEEFNDVEKDAFFRFIRGHGFDYVCDPHGRRGDMYYIPQVSPYPEHLHPTHWVGDRAIDFLQSQKGDRPWFLMTSFIHPHPPFNPPNPWQRLYRAAMMPLPKMPADYETLITYINKVQNRRKYKGHGVDQDLVRSIKAYYYACISFIDFQIGRVLDTLEQSGQMNNTLIVLSSDHGDLLGDYGCWGKRSMHDAA
jgi:arylsulfatase